MTNEEARIELLEEYRIFIEGCGLENEEYLNQQMKDNDELRKVVEANRMAIKALEQQPCEDCINRQAVLDTEYQIKEINDIEYVMLSEVQMKIRKMPPVTPKYTDEEIDKAQAVEQAYVDKMVELAVKELKTPKTEWIPVSERLPEDYVHVLCQFYLGGMGECYYLAHGSFHLVGGVVMTCNEVVAWMPLPQPYKAESEVQE